MTRTNEMMVTPGSAAKKVVGIVTDTPRIERLMGKPEGLRRSKF
jgi:hypothetical protein